MNFELLTPLFLPLVGGADLQHDGQLLGRAASAGAVHEPDLERRQLLGKEQSGLGRGREGGRNGRRKIMQYVLCTAGVFYVAVFS